jgi:hypothetical protein
MPRLAHGTRITDGAWCLVDTRTGRVLRVGDHVSFRDTTTTITGGWAPWYAGTTGRVLVDAGMGEYYPNVVNTEWVRALPRTCGACGAAVVVHPGEMDCPRCGCQIPSQAQ